MMAPRCLKLKTRDIAVVALMIAVMSALQLLVPGVGSISLWWFLDMFFFLTLCLVNPSTPEALGIGVIYVLLSIPLTKASAPLANLPMYVVYPLNYALYRASLKVRAIYVVRAAAGALFGTFFSGLIFIETSVAFFGLPQFIATGIVETVVIPVAIINAVVAQIIYYPLVNAYKRIAPEKAGLYAWPPKAGPSAPPPSAGGTTP
jgi:hypothetical protein